MIHICVDEEAIRFLYAGVKSLDSVQLIVDGIVFRYNRRRLGVQNQFTRADVVVYVCGEHIPQHIMDAAVAVALDRMRRGLDG